MEAAAAGEAEGAAEGRVAAGWDGLHEVMASVAAAAVAEHNTKERDFFMEMEFVLFGMP